jgi:hypothetical protein
MLVRLRRSVVVGCSPAQCGRIGWAQIRSGRRARVYQGPIRGFAGQRPDIMREFHGEWVRATPPRHRNGVIGMKHVRRRRLEQEAETTKGKKRRTRLKAGARFPAAHRARGRSPRACRGASRWWRHRPYAVSTFAERAGAAHEKSRSAARNDHSGSRPSECARDNEAGRSDGGCVQLHGRD